MKYTVRHIICISVWALFLLVSFESNAQTNPYYSVSYSDSLQKEPNSDFIYNNVSITNVYLKPITVNISLNTPENWKALGNQQSLLDIAPGETVVFPVVLSKLPSALAQWMPVDINIQLKNAPRPDLYTFYVKASIISGYAYSFIDNSIELQDYQKDIPITVYLKNTGNAHEHFKVQLSNYSLNLNEDVIIKMPPGKDTSYTYHLELTHEQWRRLDDEMIKIWISNDSGRRHYLNYRIKKFKSEIDQHISPYNTIPVSLEAGVYSYNNQLSYYGAISGGIAFKDSSDITYSYRTKQLGITGYQPEQYLITYEKKGFQAAIGTVGLTDPMFYAAGHGIKLSYTWKNGDFIGICGVMHYTDTNYAHDNIQAVAHYHLSKKLLIDNSVGVDFDLIDKVNSYIESNQVQLVGIKNLCLSAKVGIGMDHSVTDIPNAPKNIFGKSLGYNFGYKLGNLTVASSVIDDDGTFPGVYKGVHSQSHELDYNFKNEYIGAFYQSSYITGNFFRDSIYITSNALYNMSFYGVHAGWTAKHMSLILSTGILEQTDVAQAPPKYQSVAADYVYSTRKLNVQLDALAGYNNIINFNSNNSKNLAIMTFRGTVGSNYGGIQAYYSRIPVTTDQAAILGISNNPYRQTYEYGPYLSMYFMHRALSTRVQYNYMKTDGTPANSNVMGSLNYNNSKHGFGFSISGFSQLSGLSAGTQSYGLTARKLFNVPIITHRKYYDYTMLIFQDDNANGILDKDEQMLKNVVVYINNMPFSSDKNGTITYSNIEPGMYKMDFNKGKGIKGLVPAGGNEQLVSVTTNTTMYVPFKKGNVLSGKVIYTADSASVSFTTMDNIKIIVTDSTGKIYTTLTNEKGEYYLNLPATIYKVSLDPGAFDESIKPKQISYNVNLITNAEADVVFEIVKKNREVTIKNVEL